MTPAPFRWAMRGNLAQIRHVAAVRPHAAAGVVERVYAAAEREFGLLAPPLALHSPDQGLLAAGWLMLRETLLVAGTTSREVRETVAAAVSLANRCPYCVEVHGAVLGGVAAGRTGRANAAALVADRIDDIADPRLRAVARWARSGGVDAAPVPAGDVPELLGVFFAFQYLNRMVEVFLGPSPLPAALPAPAAPAAGALLGRVLAPTARMPVTPGADLDLLPAATVLAARPSATPDAGGARRPPAATPAQTGTGADFAWAADRPTLAVALERAAAAVDNAASRVLDPDLRSAVAAVIAEQVGAEPGLGVDPGAPVLAGLPAGQRPVARLAFLTALAPHRVDDGVVREFQATRPGQADLLAVTAWSSLTAARVLTDRAAAAAFEVARVIGKE